MGSGEDLPHWKPVPLPRVGESLYIPDLACPEHCRLVVHGGRAMVSEVSCVETAAGLVPLVRLAGLVMEWLCYDVLLACQRDLRREYGEAEVRLDPDGCFGGATAVTLEPISYDCLWEYDPRRTLPPPRPPRCLPPMRD